jgi:lipid II isoglutaminyl synthase (glutamine-hydrolysing)
VLRTLALEGAELDLFGVLNDRTADGRDVSWVWDADWEIIAPHVRRLTCAGTRAAELALRLKYAGVANERLEVVDDVEAGLDRALAAGSGPLYALPTYTALLELRDLLARRGHAPEYWR